MVNETTIDTYFVPPKYSRVLKKAVNHKKQLRPGLLDLLDHENVNETGRNKIEDFLMRPEANLLIEAAKALGRSGVLGQENEPAMILYTAALRFSKLMREYDSEDTGSGSDQIMDSLFPLIPAENRQTRWTWRVETCTYTGYRCPWPLALLPNWKFMPWHVWTWL